MAFFIRLSEKERKLAESYARLHAMSLGEAFEFKNNSKTSTHLLEQRISACFYLLVRYDIYQFIRYSNHFTNRLARNVFFDLFIG